MFAAAVCLDKIETQPLLPSFLPYAHSTVFFYYLIFQFFTSLRSHFTFLHFSSLPSPRAYSSSFSPSITLLFFPLLSPPTLSLTECCGASAAAAGSLPACYITVPSASLNHCWAGLASSRLHIELSYLKYCSAAQESGCVGSDYISIFNF